jgi:hypothetical protein
MEVGMEVTMIVRNAAVAAALAVSLGGSSVARASEFEFDLQQRWFSSFGFAGLSGLASGGGSGLGIRYGERLWSQGLLMLGIDGSVSEVETDGGRGANYDIPPSSLNSASLAIPVELKVYFAALEQGAIVPLARVGATYGLGVAHGDTVLGSDSDELSQNVRFALSGGVACFLTSHLGILVEAGIDYAHAWSDSPLLSTESSLSIAGRTAIVVTLDEVAAAPAPDPENAGSSPTN